MSLTNKDINILQEIVNVRGNCLYSKRCSECPFRSRCLPEFLNIEPPTQNQRFNMAVDVLTYHQLLQDEEAEKVQYLNERIL